MQDSRCGTRNFKNRATIALPDLDSRLIAYALVAGAALAGAPAAHAGIVYTQVNQTFSTVNAPLDFLTVNGVPQFSLTIRSSNSGGTQVRGVGVQGLAPNVFPGAFNNIATSSSSSNGHFAALLPNGFLVNGLANSYQTGAGMANAFANDPNFGPHLAGPWANVNGGFMGLDFGTFTGSSFTEFFGWARFSVSADTSPNISVTLLDYAYQTDTIPGLPGIGQPIAAGESPEPGTLGMLALGAAGLAAWRARRKPVR